MLKKIGFLLMMIFSVACAEVMAADAVGIVIAVQGTVYATDTAGVKRSLQRRSEFYLREVIATMDGSTAQLKLKDDTIISLKPNTKYAVSDFNLDARNPKNNRYVGRLVEGVLISLSGQGKNSTHDNHKLETPVVTIAIRGTLYEGGFKAKKYSYKSQGNKAVNQTIGIGWANVESGAVAVSGGGKEFNINAQDLNNNACFVTAVGKLDKKGHFAISPKAEVAITQMSESKMRKAVSVAVNAPDNSGMIVVTPAGGVTIKSNTENGVEAIVVVPAAPANVSTATTIQQSTQATSQTVISGSATTPVVVPPPVVQPPAVASEALLTPPLSPGKAENFGD